MSRQDVKTDKIRQARAARKAHRRYILCVDDEQAVLTQLIHQLTRRFGTTHRVEGAESAEDAMRLVEEFTREGSRVDLVICDQVMPGMRGDHFLEVVHQRHPETMKILLTGHAGLESATYAINNAGLNRYMEKPWDVEDLNLTVLNLLAQRTLAQEKREYQRQLERKTENLHTLHELAVRLTALPGFEEIAELVVDCAKKLSVDGRAGLYVFGGAIRTGSDLWRFSPGFELDEFGREDVMCRLFPEHDAGAAVPDSISLEDRKASDGRIDLVVFPLRAQSRIHGALICGWGHGADLADDEIELLRTLANHAAIALENRLLFEMRLRSEKLAAIGVMVSAITHDYRTPMTVIKGYAELLEMGGTAEGEQKRIGTQIVREVDRMEKMINELLDFVRGTRGSLKLEKCQLRGLLDEIRRSFQGNFAAPGVTLELGESDEITVMADPDKLKRAFTNILKNAVEAMPNGGKIRVEIAADSGFYKLDFSDTGIGIPKEQVHRIFEPFFTSQKRRGLGLGTSIARSIIEEHGGSISLSSEVGKGTTVTVSLPRAPADK